MFETKNLSISVSDRYLIKDLNLSLNKKDKLGIIGEEGNGKSTLLKSILGKCEYATITGSINTKGNKIGYLEQSIEEDLTKKVYDYLFLNDIDYYNKISNLYKYLEKLNLNDKILEQKLEMLSGGEKVKIGILKLLLEENDILFLDEPTNDLDIETLTWLENFILKTEKPIVFISHDETLLSKTANIILHLEQTKHKTECKHTLIKIDYTSYVENRLKTIEKQTKQSKFERKEYNKKQEKLMKIMNKVEYEQNTISRGKPHGAALLKKKMHSLKSQEKRLANTELTEKPDIEESINIFFEGVTLPKSKVIIKLELPALSIGNKVLSKNINLEVIGNTHLCIIGKNGTGKTTLIKEIHNKLKNRKDITLGYMPQNYDEILNKYDTVLDFITDETSKDEITKSRMYLGNMKLTKEEMTGKISNLSNGTKAKLFLMKLVLNKCDCLILDEPTRNLSPLSNPVIRKMLKNFNGAIISVSHDRKYIEEVIDTLYILTKDGLTKIAK